MLSKSYPLITVALAIAGGFVVLTTFAFAQGTANAIDFAIGIGITVLGLVALATAPAERRRTHRALSGAVVAIGAWTILVTLGIFSGDTQNWLVFGSGAAVAAAGLTAHGLYEAGRERRVAALETGTANGTVTVEGRPRVATAA
jgi:peptidoglycan/LPS O-acetylase OafA/YrhL